MKKLFLFLAILSMVAMAVDAQTTIKQDEVRTVTVGTLLVSGDSVLTDFYGKDFFVVNKVQVQADTATGTGTGDVVVNVIRQGSLNYVDWTTIDTVAISGTDNTTGVSSATQMYWDYLRFKTKVAGTGDSVAVYLNTLFDVNY